MSDAATNAIVLRDVRKTYGKGNTSQQVLRGVSLDIRPGELVALVGQSGSGKSTLLNLVGALDTPDAGTVVVDGQDLGKLKESELARLRNERLGFVFQSFHLLEHLSVLENVFLSSFFGPPKERIDERARAALERVGIGALADRRPGALSGGQKQRVAIARALFARPAILLCDEPTGNLDSETGEDVIRFFEELNERDGTTLLIVTHEERVSSRVRRVIRIQDGLITSDELTGKAA